MGTLETFESLLIKKDCMFLFVEKKIYCGCGIVFANLQTLLEHLETHEDRCGDTVDEEDPAEILRRKFIFPSLKSEEGVEVKVLLPPGLTCICLNEHDLGTYSDTLTCHLCNNKCDNLELLNKHIARIHKVSQVLIGENVKFERPEHSTSSIMISPPRPNAFFCPMIRCKYHIVESSQTKYFKTFKLLKQHYVKVHSSKNHHCPTCSLTFGAAVYQELHSKTCGQEFFCSCGSKFSALESLQTHSRRKDHQLDPKYLKVKVTTTPDMFSDKLTMIQRRDPLGLTYIPIAPKPSAMHINAAIALSELGVSGGQIYTPKADIGIQTEYLESLHNKQARKSCTPGQEADPLVSPNRAKRGSKVSTETQTKSGKRKIPTVSSHVQTLGEFSVKPKKIKMENMLSSQGSQCRMSPAKKVDQETVTTMTSNVVIPGLGFSLSVDIPDFEDLWPLRLNTNWTQTSPRVASITRKISMDSEDSLPELEKIINSQGEIVDTESKLIVEINNSYSSKHQDLSQIRQFSTETQTELDKYLDSWQDNSFNNSLLDVEKLITTEMETQTHEDNDEVLLCANTCTQTGFEDDDLIKRLLFDKPYSLNNSELPGGCSAETQTCLTGFQNEQIVEVVGLQDNTVLTHIETQTVESVQDFLGL